MIADALSQFHFLRPLWLLMIIPATLLIWLLLQRSSRSSSWHGAINDSLLQHLSDGRGNTVSRIPLYGLWLGLLLAATALAGPTWEKMPQPVHQRQDALVVVLDLSLSMLAEDIKPSRLVRARHKILDILALRNEGLTGLVVYSGDAHVVTPLTDDNATIANLVPALSPLMMPVIGSDPESAVRLSETLLSSAGLNTGSVLLITDDISERDLDRIDDSLHRRGIRLSVLGVGTRDGAPIPADKGFLKDEAGNIIVPRLDSDRLERLAALNSGRYTTIGIDNSDIRFLLPPLSADIDTSNSLSEREFDQWQDRGAWLCLLLIPFAALAFRRGLILTLVLPLLLVPERSLAFDWQDLWQRPDQRGQQQLQSGDPEAAANTFENPAWKGSAHYRAENYQAAAEQFSTLNDADAHFNRGNALARAGQLDQAIAAYDQALELNPKMEDAAFNRQLVKKLLDRQSEQQSQQQSGDQSQDQSKGQNDQQQSSSNQQQQSQQQQNQQQSDSQDSQQEKNSSSQQDAADSSSENTETAKQDSNEPQAEQRQADNKQLQQRPDGDQETTDDESGQLSESVQAQIDQRQQATEQWLRQIPDDPAGLLRRKFNYESQIRQQQGEQQREQPRW